jgi:hypothetical protein
MTAQENDQATITELTPGAEHYSVMTDCGWGFGVAKQHGEVLRVGDVIRVHTTQGSMIRGVDVCRFETEWEILFYKTDDDLQQEHDAFVAKKRADTLAEKPKSDALLATLPEEFQRRVARFRAINPLFDEEFLPYEVFVCEQAVRIVEALPTKEALRAWWKLDSLGLDVPQEERELSREQFYAMVPGLSHEHSGNTMGKAAQLAFIYVDEPAWVELAHGALDGLVGCEEYGCFASLPDEEQERVMAELGLKLVVGEEE